MTDSPPVLAKTGGGLGLADLALLVQHAGHRLIARAIGDGRLVREAIDQPQQILGHRLAKLLPPAREVAEKLRLLTQVAPGAARRIPKYRQMYERIKREKCANIAKSAVARRLIEDAWTLLMRREPFRLMPVQAETLTRAG